MATTSNTDDSVSLDGSYSSMRQFRSDPLLFELFDASRVKWIIDNPSAAFDLLPVERQHVKEELDLARSHYVRGWQESLSDLRELLIMSDPSDDPRYRVHRVSYRRIAGTGRRYAHERGALATMQRELRQCIAHPSLRDYDCTNMHPVILHWLCTREGGLGIKCPILTDYVLHRDTFLKKKFRNPKKGKTVLLTLINSDRPDGTAHYRGKDAGTVRRLACISDKKILRKLEVDANQVRKKLKPFIAEMIHIQKAFVARYRDKYDQHVITRDKKKKNFNYMGSFVNTFLLQWEGRILDIIYDEIGRPMHCSHQYDGLQTSVDVDCDAVSRRLKREFGIHIHIREKPRKEALGVPEGLELYEDQKYSFNKMLCSRYETTIADGRRGMPYSLASAIARKTLTVQTNDKGAIGQVSWALITSSQGIPGWWRKEYRFVSTDKFLSKCDLHANIFHDKYGTCDEKGKPYPRFMVNPASGHPYSFRNLVVSLRNQRALPAYTGNVYVPRGPLRVGDKINLYTPPRWRLSAPIDLIAEEGSATWWKMVVFLCSGNVPEAKHFLAHIADMVQHPEKLRGIAHIFVSKQGAGKGLLFWFISRVLGETNTSIIGDATKYFSQGFNKTGCDSILRTFEEIQMGACKKHNEQFKEEITRQETTVREKYMNDVVHTNYSRVWGFSNHEAAIYVEDAKERRLTTHKCVDGPHINNKSFFAPIVAKIKSDEWIAGVYSYLMNYKYTEDEVSTVFDNSFKRKIRSRSEPKTITFLKWLIITFADVPDMFLLRGTAAYNGDNTRGYLKDLLTEFEEDKGIKKVSIKAIDTRLADYGFTKVRDALPRKVGEESIIRVWHTPIHIADLIEAIEKETCEPYSDWIKSF